MRSNSESFATKCFTEQPTPCDCTPVMYATAMRADEVRVLGVALEVAAGERMPVDVHRRREQHVRTACGAPRSPMRCADLLDEVGIPRRAERGAARERRRRPPGPALAARADRAVGDLQRRDAEPLDRGGVPQVDAGDHRRLLVDRQLAEQLCSIRVVHRSHPRSATAGALPACADEQLRRRIRRQGRGRHRRGQRDRPGARARVRGRAARASSRPTSSRRARRDRGQGSRTHHDRGDRRVAASTTVAALADHAFETYGTVDVLCNNAGVFAGGLIWERPAERLRVDARRQPLGHPARDPRVRAPHARVRNDPAHIVNTVSMAGLCSTPFTAPTTSRSSRRSRRPSASPTTSRQSARRSACRWSCRARSRPASATSGRNRPDAARRDDVRRRARSSSRRWSTSRPAVVSTRTMSRR